ncbi:hypothetical protein CBR_g4874 [Chara braunii]|uniref:C-terminal processing peptidase n=1 Tax=Chara braunii TaxID=69332 RepID=A0A388KJ44_CHABU|nr:hypothetical protein CBR_g4874 [Chara braunii]|eukprot:GBG70046.1 hypothetical protein CBR_g4874 [Chara braunii]
MKVLSMACTRDGLPWSAVCCLPDRGRAGHFCLFGQAGSNHFVEPAQAAAVSTISSAVVGASGGGGGRGSRRGCLPIHSFNPQSANASHNRTLVLYCYHPEKQQQRMRRHISARTAAGIGHSIVDSQQSLLRSHQPFACNRACLCGFFAFCKSEFKSGDQGQRRMRQEGGLFSTWNCRRRRRSSIWKVTFGTWGREGVQVREQEKLVMTDDAQPLAVRTVTEEHESYSKECTLSRDRGLQVKWQRVRLPTYVQHLGQHVAGKACLLQLLTWQSRSDGWYHHCGSYFELVKMWLSDKVGKRRRTSTEEEVSGRRRRLVGLLGSTAVVTMLLVIGRATVLPPLPSVALTEENLVFLEAWRTLDRAFIDKSFNGQSWFRYRENVLKSVPMNSREQTYNAIRQMAGSLNDPFTRFLEPEKFRSLRTGTNGSLTGVGLEIAADDHDPSKLVVVAPVAGGPAERAGIQAGDAILEIGGEPISAMSLYDAALRLQGPEGSTVSLVVQRPAEDRPPSTINLTRQRVMLNPVSWKLCVTADGSHRIGYIRFSSFNSNSSVAMREAIKRLKEGGATSFILDIRNNNGGLFPSGIEIAKMWLDRGVIVYIVDNKGVRDIFEAEGSDSLAPTEPLAVLVNKGTASASEILAGALKDNGRAVILGEPTFGKGKIQSVFELSDGSGMAVTVARYETPAHIDIDKVGIEPDKPLPSSLPDDPDGFCKCITDPHYQCGISPQTLFSRR